MYSLVYKSSVKKEFASIPKKDVENIIKKIKGLKANPLPVDVKKIKKGAVSYFRLRCGNFRIGYLLDFSEKVVRIVYIRKRNESTYSNL